MSILQIQSTFSMKQYFDVFILILPCGKTEKRALQLLQQSARAYQIIMTMEESFGWISPLFLHCKCSNSVLITVYCVHYY